jgi:Domain of unknown function (DUF4422)
MTERNLRPLRFFVSMYKDAPVPLCEHYSALGVGGYRPTTMSLRAFSDSVGDSISEKNFHYSELTAWYWIWKNVIDVNTIGLCHYRRYFVLDENEGYLTRRRNRRLSGLNIEGRLSLRRKPETIHFHPDSQSFAYLTSPGRTRFVEETLARSDVIVARRQWRRGSIAQQYAASHVQEDWDLFLQGIKELYPHYAREIKWFDEAQYVHPYNMMISSKGYFDTYMSTLFPLLFWMEKEKPFRLEQYQCRAPAFLAERFFTFYLHVTGARCVEVPIAISEITAV